MQIKGESILVRHRKKRIIASCFRGLCLLQLMLLRSCYATVQELLGETDIRNDANKGDETEEETSANSVGDIFILLNPAIPS